jgi:hypothetical protein
LWWKERRRRAARDPLERRGRHRAGPVRRFLFLGCLLAIAAVAYWMFAPQSATVLAESPGAVVTESPSSESAAQPLPRSDHSQPDTALDAIPGTGNSEAAEPAAPGNQPLIPDDTGVEPPSERDPAQADAARVSPPTGLIASGDPTYVGAKPPARIGSPAPANLGLEDGTVFGQQVLGLRSDLLERLRRAEQEVAGSAPTADRSSIDTIDTIVGFRRGSRSHSQGLAVDINYFANPYVMHERGEEALDARLGPIYHRIARLTLGRDSVIPEQITVGTVTKERALRLYRELAEESRAMIVYFQLMQDRNRLARSLDRLRLPNSDDVTGGLLSPAGLDTPESIQRRMMADYVELSGHAGPAVGDLVYPTLTPVAGADRPFAGDPRYRGPELGFLDLSEELVRALLHSGVRWGATDMGSASGDVMHFYLPSDKLESRKAPGPVSKEHR